MTTASARMVSGSEARATEKGAVEVDTKSDWKSCHSLLDVLLFVMHTKGPLKHSLRSHLLSWHRSSEKSLILPSKQN